MAREAGELGRALRSLGAAIGTPIATADGLFVALDPAARPPRPRALVARLWAGDLADARAIGELLGARAVEPLDAARCNRLARRLADVERRVTLATGAVARALRADGADTLLDEVRARAAGLRAVVEGYGAARAWLGGDGPRSAASAVAALPVRLGALAAWVDDPVRALVHARGGDVDAALAAGTGLARAIAAARAGEAGAVVAAPARAAHDAGAWAGLEQQAVGARRAIDAIAIAYGPARAAAAARALLEGDAAHRDAVRAGGSVGLQPTATVQRARIALGLAHPGARLPVPPELRGRQVRELVDLALELPGARAAALWPALVAALAGDGLHVYERRLATGDLPEDLCARAIAQRVASAAWELRDDARNVRRYLDCVEQLAARLVRVVSITDDWFVELFSSGGAWAPALALALVSRARSASSVEDALVSLRATAEALGARGGLLGQALEGWATVSERAAVPEVSALSRLLGVEPAVLEQLAHYRLLAGERDPLPSSLTRLLDETERRRRELAHLQEQVTRDGMPPERRAAIEARIDRLVAERGALAPARVRREARRVARALDEQRRASLDAVLDGACREAVAALIGRPLPPGPLLPGLRDAFALLHAGGADLDVLRAFLIDVIERRPLHERPANQTWLARARAAGVDVDAWRAGLRATVQVGGQAIELATETDPLHVLRMGVYFDTCLSLRDGCNAASTLINAVDVNKHVIYGRRGDGTVVARKLIGATARGELAGYNTYAFERQPELRAQLTEVIRAFAERCGLRLSDTATPEELHPGLWYDDGNEAWVRPVDAQLPAPPDDVPPDDAARAEWNLVQAARAGDRARAVAVALAGADDDWAQPACFRMVRTAGDAPLPEDWPVPPWQRYRAAELATSLGELGWLAMSPDGDDFDPLSALLCGAPADARGAARVVDAAQAVLARGGDDDPSEPAPHLALAPLSELVELFSDLVQELGAVEAPAWARRWLAMWRVAYLRERDPEPLVRALRDGPPIAGSFAVFVAGDEVVPGSAPQLRRWLERATRETSAPIALALGSQADPDDRARLRAVAERWPDSLRAALGAARGGVDGAAALWSPPVNVAGALRGAGFVSALGERAWIDAARELGAPQLARRVRRELVRELEAERAGRSRRGTPGVLRWLGYLGALGDRELAPLAVAESLGFTAPSKTRAAAELAQRTWRAARALAGGRTGDVADWSRCGLLGDARVERAVLARVAAGEEPALRAWIDAAPPPWRWERASLALALVDPARAELGARRAAVEALLPACDQEHEAAAAALLPWIDALPDDERWPAVWRALPLHRSWANSSYLIALGFAERRPELAARAADGVPAGAPVAQLLAAVDTALHWLHPDAAEPLARAVVARIEPGVEHRAVIAARLRGVGSVSYRLQRMLVESYVARADVDERAAILGEVGATPRRPWLKRVLVEAT